MDWYFDPRNQEDFGPTLFPLDRIRNLTFPHARMCVCQKNLPSDVPSPFVRTDVTTDHTHLSPFHSTSRGFIGQTLPILQCPTEPRRPRHSRCSQAHPLPNIINRVGQL